MVYFFCICIVRIKLKTLYILTVNDEVSTEFFCQNETVAVQEVSGAAIYWNSDHGDICMKRQPISSLTNKRFICHVAAGNLTKTYTFQDFVDNSGVKFLGASSINILSRNPYIT